MNKQEALAKARAAKKAKQEVGNGTNNNQNPPVTSSIQPEDRYTPEMNDDDVIAFCQRHTKGKSADEITDTNILEALVRYGEIMTSRRVSAEGEGKAAKLKIIKNEVGKLEKRFAVASLLNDLAFENQRKHSVGQPVEIPFELVIRVAGEELVISLQTVENDHGTGQQMGVFVKALQDISKIVMTGCQRTYHSVNAGNGEAFGVPFDFQRHKNEIRNKATGQ